MTTENLVTQVALTDLDRALCLKIRREVFIEEQGVAESIEMDQYENESTYFLTYLQGEAVATGRLRQKKYYAKFERIATMKKSRGQGVGQNLMQFMLGYAQSNYPELLAAMHAQKSAAPFYEKLGWTAVGDEFFEAGIAHVVFVCLPRDQVALEGLQALSDPELHHGIARLIQIARDQPTA